MTNREKQLIDAAIQYADGRLALDEFKGCVLALQVERERDAEEGLLNYIVERAKRDESSGQRLHLIRLAIKQHDQHWQTVLGKVAG